MKSGEQEAPESKRCGHTNCCQGKYQVRRVSALTRHVSLVCLGTRLLVQGKQKLKVVFAISSQVKSKTSEWFLLYPLRTEKEMVGGGALGGSASQIF